MTSESAPADDSDRSARVEQRRQRAVDCNQWLLVKHLADA